MLQHKQHIKFDPSDVNHLKYYDLLETGILSPEYRFILEGPFLDILNMMRYKIAQYHIKQN